ncbi:ATP-binding protein [Desulfolucanica intricata]|uniref:ATP-binding protein n=1 Tax=Desulfolucanica intricata TaxID=1285191 RepID=UPI000A78772D|nr:ATP-binding protein [Desulfolucanica intricata]
MGSFFQVNEARKSAGFLFIYRNITEQPIFKAFIKLLDCLSVEETNVSELIESYQHVFSLLAEAHELSKEEIIGDAWQNYLLDAILTGENSFSRKAEIATPADMGESLINAVKLDLQRLQLLWQLDAQRISGAVLDKVSDNMFGINLPTWDNFKFLKIAGVPGEFLLKKEIKETLASSENWAEQFEMLASYYACAGSGVFGQYKAFRWVKKGNEGHLEGVAMPDPVSLNDLIGSSEERAEVIKNTEMFLQGCPANNVLLYGDRGTGKSSTVKAILNEYAHRGLRLIEVPRNALTDFSEIIALLRNRAGKFILFVDDLSFEDHEVEYKDMKAILEGGIEARPSNVLIYATSNRRHLVKEYFADRKNTSDEVRMGDSVQEKLSLADRFGITVVFTTPDQNRYLEIVEGLARQRELDINFHELRRRALQWELWHNGRSGRTARQFIDHLTGELVLSKVVE